MSRRRAAEKREVLPDAKFGDIVLSKFMNTLMERGKKSVAESVVYGALEEVESRLKQDPTPAFQQAFRALPLVSAPSGPLQQRRPRHSRPPHRALPQHRYHGAYRRRQDDHDRAHPLLHRQVA